MPKAVIASTQDALGRTVILTQDRWEHILDGHPELDGLELAVMRVVDNADMDGEGNFPGARKLAKRGLGPSRWLVAVVKYDGAQGSVVTAYPCTADPRIEP